MLMRVLGIKFCLSLLSPCCVYFPVAYAQENTPPLEAAEAIAAALDKDDFFQAEALLSLVPSRMLAEPRFLVFRALVEKGFYRFTEAEQLLKIALRVDDHYGDALFEMALIQMEKKNWKDADVLLRLAAESDDLSKNRENLLSYYLGVVSFESGRVFDSKTSFLRLNWGQALDPALEQSAAAYLSRIARVRPWSIVAPLSYQYESNVLGLNDAAELPEGYTQRHAGKLIAGMFSSMTGLGGDKPGEGPWGVGLRILNTRSLESQFNSMNVVFLESEANWSRLLNQKLGVLRLSLLANLVKLGGQSTSSSYSIKTTILESEFSIGFESDLQKSSSIDRSSYFFRGAREWLLVDHGTWGFGVPLDFGFRVPNDKSKPGEFRSDVSVLPTLSFFPDKRSSIKVNGKIGAERVSDATSTAYNVVRFGPGFTMTFTVQPYLILSGGASYELEKKSLESGFTRKNVYSLGFMGLL